MDTLDVTLLEGFEFACRPGCGLCCFTTPFVTDYERSRLVQIEPAAEFSAGPAGGQVVRSRANGGACWFLSDYRCRCHTLRPFPCAEFPLTVHLGARAQASVVLTCPGVDLSVLRSWGGPDGRQHPPKGFEEELGRVRAEYDRWVTTGQVRRTQAIFRRRLRRLRAREGWKPEEEVRTELRAHLPFPTDREFPVADLPDATASPESLPLWFDHELGRVALRAVGDGAELVELTEDRGIGRSHGVFPLPRRMPELDSAARSYLVGYLAYWLARDQLIDLVSDLALESEDEASLTEVAAGELRLIGAQVLSRAAVRRSAVSSERGPLSAEEVVEGIRATDLDWLDRSSPDFRL